MPRKAADFAVYAMTLACDALQVDAGIQPRLVLNHRWLRSMPRSTRKLRTGMTRCPLDVAFQVEGASYAADGHRPAAAAGRPCAARCIPAHTLRRHGARRVCSTLEA